MKRPLLVLLPLGLLVGFALLLLFKFIAGQTKARESAATLNYGQHGISFTYPEVWRLWSDTGFDGFRSLGFETWDGSVCIIQIEDADTLDESLLATGKAFSAAAVIDEGMVKSGDTSFVELESEDGFERVVEDFAVVAVGVEVPMRRSYYRKHFGERSVTIIFQSDVPVRGGLQRGLALIKGSLEVVSP